MAVVSAEVRFAPQLTAWFTANPTKVLQDGEIVYCSDGANVGKYVIGDNSTQLSALTFYGGISSSGLTVGTTTITGGTNTKVLYNNNGVVGEYTVTGSGSAVLNTSPVFVTGLTTPLINGTSGTLQIGTTDLVNIGNKITTNQRLVRIGQDTAWIDFGSRVGATNQWAIYGNQATPSAFNGVLYGDANSTALASAAGGTISITNYSNIALYTNTAFTHTAPSGLAGGAYTGFTFIPGAHTNQTATTNIPNFKVTGSTKQWATGALATQYFNYFSANTVAFAGASTATNVYGLYVEAATAGTNATITNNYAAGFSGNVNIIGTPHVSGVAGVDGTFTTVDGKTVTVSKGLITAIV